MAPATEASKESWVPASAAARYSSEPCWASRALLPVTTATPREMARWISDFAGSIPPSSSITMSAWSTRASASVV